MSPKDKGDREAILSRRRLFVASAMASIVVAEPACETLFLSLIHISEPTRPY